MRALTTIDRWVLDSLQDDYESISSILTFVDCPYTAKEIEESLRRLLGDRLIERVALVPSFKTPSRHDDASANIQEDWFDLTDKGREVASQFMEEEAQ